MEGVVMVAAWEVGDKTDPRDKPIAQLLADLSEELRRLARAEVKLAVIEGKRKAKRAGVGAGAFGAAGLFAVIGICVLVAAAVLALALVWPAWLAALVIGGGAVVIAGIAAIFGRGALKRALPPVPQWAITSVRDDIDTIKRGARHDHRTP
jgi:Putative Actinobacterial Holin-X, holin superfamily III